MLGKILNKYAPEAKFTKFWNNKRLRAVSLLLFWFAFFLICYLVVFRPALNYENHKSNTSNVNEIQTAEYDEIKNNLLNYNFNFNITYQNGDDKINYNGNFENKTSASFYVEDKSGITKILLKDSKYYKVNMDEEAIIEINNAIFDLESLFQKLEQIEPDIVENTYVFAKDEVYGKISVEENNISKIEYKEGNEEYLYEFTDIK